MLGEFMYESFFNLKTKPFELLPNFDFLFLSKSHKRVLSYLDYGIQEGLGFILLTGEVGSGKTTIIRSLVKKCDNNVILARIFNTYVDSVQLLAMINEEFGLSTSGKGKVELLRELNDFLIDQHGKNKRAALIIDEAQNLSANLLEEVRMLSNLETERAKLLQIILVGQPELRSTLEGPEMLQLRQRISISCHLSPMTRTETEQYILHRLDVAGGRESVNFCPEAFDLIHNFSRGIPRLINIMCDFLMLSAFAEETRNIDGVMVKDIAGDLDFEKNYWGSEPVPPGSTITGQSEAPLREMGTKNEDITILLEDIRNRLETLEKSAIVHEEDITNVMTDKFISLEKAFLHHVQKTGSTVSEISRKLEEVIITLDNSSAIVAETKSKKTGFVSRIFG